MAYFEVNSVIFRNQFSEERLRLYVGLATNDTTGLIRYLSLWIFINHYNLGSDTFYSLSERSLTKRDSVTNSRTFLNYVKNTFFVRL